MINQPTIGNYPQDKKIEIIKYSKFRSNTFN